MIEALTRDYRIGEEIGRGRFGVVNRCEPLDPSAAPSASDLTVKSIDKSAVSGDDLDSHCLLTEPKVLSLLSPHPNLLRIHNAYEDSSHLHLVLDLCDSTDLHLAIASAGPLPEPESAPILAQLMRAVTHCHQSLRPWEAVVAIRGCKRVSLGLICENFHSRGCGGARHDLIATVHFPDTQAWNR